MTYVNPLSRIAGLVPERIDQGVDYGGTGPILAIGNGTVLETQNSGWPGGAFIAIKLADGQYAGNIVYYAEDITPSVTVGQEVTAGEVVGEVFNGGSGIEIGWGSPNIGESLARYDGQISPTGDPGSVSSAYGASFSAFLVSLGAPGGRLQGAIVGSVSGNYPSPAGGTPPPMTQTTMYDALEASGIPHGAAIACWYPHDSRSDGPPVGAKVVLTIDNTGDHPDCHILDVENGAASFASVPGWLDANKNQFPTIYASESNVPAVVQAADNRTFHLWVAHWGTGPTEIFFPQYNTVKTVAHQYEDAGAYDLSVVYGVYPWYDNTAPPPPPPPPPGAPALVSALEYRGVTLRYGDGTPPYTVAVWTDPENKIVFSEKVSAVEVGVQPLTPGQLYAWQVTDANGKKSPVATFTIS